MKSGKALKISQIVTLVLTVLTPGQYLGFLLHDMFARSKAYLYIYDLSFMMIDRILTPILFFGIWLLPAVWLVMMTVLLITFIKNKDSIRKGLTAAAVLIPFISYIAMMLYEFGGGELLS